MPSTPPDEETYFFKESNYYTIKLKKRINREDGNPLESLVLDHLVHSYTDLNDPLYLEYEYIRMYEEMVRWQARKEILQRPLPWRRWLYLSPFYRGEISQGRDRCRRDRSRRSLGWPEDILGFQRIQGSDPSMRMAAGL